MQFFKSKPSTSLETDRLLLRRPTRNDDVDYHRILSCPEITKYSDLPHNPSEKRSKQFVRWMSKLPVRGTGVAWMIMEKNSNTLVGAVRLYHLEKKAQSGTVAYEVHPDVWNLGIATEALTAVVSHAHNAMALNRIEAWASEGNVASEQVLLKTGFQYEGTQREKVYFQERYWNVRLYGRLIGDKHNKPA